MINKKKLLLIAQKCSFTASVHGNFLQKFGKMLPVDDFSDEQYPDWFIDMIDYGLSMPSMEHIERLLKEMKDGNRRSHK